jgi:hypothetical protein
MQDLFNMKHLQNSLSSVRHLHLQVPRHPLVILVNPTCIKIVYIHPSYVIIGFVQITSTEDFHGKLNLSVHSAF